MLPIETHFGAKYQHVNSVTVNRGLHALLNKRLLFKYTCQIRTGNLELLTAHVVVVNCVVAAFENGTLEHNMKGFSKAPDSKVEIPARANIKPAFRER